MSIIVTGGARGIGRAVVELLLEEGRSVVAVDLDPGTLGELDSPRLAVVVGDVTEQSTIDAGCEAASPLTGVVANAGISRPGPSEACSEADWNAVLDLNLGAVFRVVRSAAARAAGGASFVAISSILGSQGFGGRASYAASKAGVEGLVRALAVEYAPRVRINAVSPGFVRTDIAQANIAKGVIDNKRIMARTPMRRWGEPADVAAAVSFLLGEQSSWITGTTLTVDGGWLAHGLDFDDGGGSGKPTGVDGDERP